MGIYTCCFMFHGVLIGEIGYDKLIKSNEYKTNEQIWKSYIKKINDSHWLLFIPNTHHTFQAIDSMLDVGDIERGYVLMNEIKSIILRQFKNDVKVQMLLQDQLDITDISNNELVESATKELVAQKYNEVFHIDEKQTSILNTLIQIAKPDNNKPVVPKWYYIEGKYSTLDSGDLSIYRLENKYEIREETTTAANCL